MPFRARVSGLGSTHSIFSTRNGRYVRCWLQLDKNDKINPNNVRHAGQQRRRVGERALLTTYVHRMKLSDEHEKRELNKYEWRERAGEFRRRLFVPVRPTPVSRRKAKLRLLEFDGHFSFQFDRRIFPLLLLLIYCLIRCDVVIRVCTAIINNRT